MIIRYYEDEFGNISKVNGSDKNERLIPLTNKGVPLRGHMHLNKLVKKENGNFYDRYLLTADAKGKYQPDIEENNKLKVKLQSDKLNSIFYQKTIDIKAIACDKKGSNDYINAQYEVYENMYKNALDGLFDTANNEAIIAANEAAKALVGPITLLVNEIRHEADIKIEANVCIYSQLEDFKNAVLDVNDLTELQKIYTDIMNAQE